jgi:hypothetical protein
LIGVVVAGWPAMVRVRVIDVTSRQMFMDNKDLPDSPI